MEQKLYTHAIVRPPGDCFAQAISSLNIPPNPALARLQHVEYCQALEAAGVAVEALPPDERFPDSCFVQDTALIVGGQAILARLAAPSRRGEEELIPEALQARFPLSRIRPPGTLEGGDVLLLPGRVLVGQTARTNDEGIRQLQVLLEPLGLPVTPVPVGDYLHLLSAVTHLGDGVLLAANAFASHPALAGMQVITLPDEEAYAANVLGLGEKVILPAGYPKAAEALGAYGFETLPVPLTEFAAADGGATCLSLVWRE